MDALFNLIMIMLIPLGFCTIAAGIEELLQKFGTTRRHPMATRIREHNRLESERWAKTRAYANRTQ